LRAIFEAGRKIGICKINSKYIGGHNRGALKPKASISFIKKEPLSPQQLQNFEESLKAINVKLCDYVPEKEPKVCLIL
jgi:hypothetical protein